MSKVVKGVGRAIGKVVKGAAKIATIVPRKLAKSKVGRVVLAAALVYFGGAALMGGMSTIGTSTSFLSGMGSGLSSAATGIGNAFTALTQGNLSGAGSALSQGFTGTAAQGAATAANAAAVTPGMSVAPLTPTQTALQSALGTTTGINTLPAGVTTVAPAANPGILSSAWNSLGPYGKAAAISGGTQIAGGLIQGAGMQRQADRQEELNEQQKADQQATYNRNIGTPLWARRA